MTCDPRLINEVGNLVESNKDPFSIDVKPIINDVPTGRIPGGIALSRAMLNFMYRFRTMRGAFGDELAFALNQTQRHEVVLHNKAADYLSRFMDAFAPTMPHWWDRIRGIPHEPLIKVGELLDKHVDMHGNYKGPEGAFDPMHVTVAKGVRTLLNEGFKDFGVDPAKFLNFYFPRIVKNPTATIADIVKTPEGSRWYYNLNPIERTFFHEYERSGRLRTYEMNAATAFTEYIYAGINSKYRAPFLDQMDREVMRPHFGVVKADMGGGRIQDIAVDPTGYEFWKDYTKHMMGKATPASQNFMYQFKKLGAMFGYEPGPRTLHNAAGVTENLYWSGAIGGPLGTRPASFIRHLTRLVPTFAELGPKAHLQGMQLSFDPAQRLRMKELGLISAPFEKLVNQTDVAASTGRVISEVSRGTLKLFAASDAWLRSVTALGSEAKFNDYLARDAIEKMSIRPQVREKILGLARQGKTDQARLEYMTDNMFQLEYAYGPANKPAIFRGPLGSLAGMFTAYPLNTFEMWKSMGKRALTPRSQGGDPMPLARLLAVIGGVMYGGSEFLHANLGGIIHQTGIPTSLALPKMGLDAFHAAHTTAEHLVGSLFMLGETDTHKNERQQALHHFVNDMKPFVPGGVFALSDVPQAIDQGTLLRLLGVTPLASDLNAQRRKRVRELAREKQLTREPRLILPTE